MYQMVNEVKARRAEALAKAEGKAGDEATVLYHYDRLGGLVRDENGIDVPTGSFEKPTSARAKEVEAPKEEVKEEKKPKKSAKKSK